MLRPFLLVGVGGSGGKTLRALYQSLNLRLQQEGWKQGWPKAWQLLHVDSPTIQDGAEFPAPFLPSENYVGLVAPGTSYQISYSAAANGVPQKHLVDVQRALPPDKDVAVNVTIGAGKFRAIGRTLVLAKLSEVNKQAQMALSRMTSDGALSELETLALKLGAKPGTPPKDPIVIVISSIAGGSGAGQFLEVTEAIKNCAPSQPWVHNIFSLLYAPDVFQSVGDMDLIAPNSLAAMTESMSGMWARNLPESTISLYKAKAINIPGLGNGVPDANFHIGPKFNYVIGRENSTIDFSDQPSVYKAVAASLSTWITDEHVQGKLLAYNVANFVADAGAMALPDTSNLDETRTAPPFASMGFGRVTLGKELFLQYASERLARSAVDRMLYAHLADHNAKDGKWQERVESDANQTLPNFMQDIRFGRGSDNELEFIKLLRPQKEREVALELFQNEILSEASQGISAKTQGMPAAAWADAIFGSYQIKVAANSVFMNEELKSLIKNEKAWVSEQKDATLRRVSRAISQQGIKVGLELLRMASIQLLNESKNLRETARSCEAASAPNAIQSRINGATQSITGSTPVRPNDPVVPVAILEARNGFWYKCEAQLHNVAAALLQDYVDNFLEPLRNALITNEDALVKRITTQGDTAHTQNLFISWPKVDQETVPKKFDPAPNEYLLIGTSQYPSEFRRLVDESVDSSRRSNAIAVVIDEILMGSLEIEDLDQAIAWSLISISRDWIPIRRESRKDESQSSQNAKFEFSSDPFDYLLRAQRWMQRQGSSFHQYLHEDIASYLNENMNDKSLLVDRQNMFRQQFTEALRASEPLVKLNPGLLDKVHKKQIGDRDSVFSKIPFDRGSSNYEICRKILSDAKLWEENTSDDWFNSALKVQNIDIFSVQLPYQPIVMDSIMKPVWQAWLKHRGSLDTRENFLQWRKARPLFEAIPASDEKKYAMIRGWYVAKALGQLNEEFEDAVLGPKLSIYSAGQQRYEAFPYPLLYPGITPPEDYPGAILNSLAIALALCNSEANLEPLIPFHRLMELGDTSTTSDLLTWVVRGAFNFANLPTPSKERAGSKDDSVDVRKKAIISYFEDCLQDFAETIENIDHRGDTSKLNYTWEIRQEIRDSINELIQKVSAVKERHVGI